MLHRPYRVLATCRTARASLPAARPAAVCRANHHTVAAASTASKIAETAHRVSVETEEWGSNSFPTYLQAIGHLDPLSSIKSYSSVDSLDANDPDASLWKALRREAHREAANEPLLSSFLYASVLGHDCFERSLAFVLAERLQNNVMLVSQLFDTFYQVLANDSDVRDGALADIIACQQRDPACMSAITALLYYKGYHALQTHRIAHALYTRGHRVMALALQNRLSEALGVDIHPGAQIGKGIFLDHACGVVIGETAVIGDNVTIMQDVTLGGTGKESGDRHPKIADNVLIGAASTVLGNIHIAEGVLIAPGSLVLKPVQPYAMVAGSPAKVVGMRPQDQQSGVPV